MTLATSDSADAVESYRHGSAAARIGMVIADTYRIARQIGSGGSSDVFEAEHLRLGTLFAVKVLRDVDRCRRAVERFRREARIVARLQGEHIVRVLDCGELEDSTPYLVMELLEGEDLRKLLNRETAIPARRAVQLVREACHALTEVHQAGLVHRDLKPENLFVSRRSTGEDWCKVLDFGVAKMEASLATAQGAVLGTVRYMAPEQLADSASVGPATDVYALGAVLYECLSGHSLHAGGTVQEVMFSVMNRTPVSLGRLCPNLPKTLVDVVERCVAKRPMDRPQQASELARLLSSALVDERGSVGSATTSPEEEEPVAATPRASLRQPHGAPGTPIPPRSPLLPIAVAALVGAAGTWLVKPTLSKDEHPPRVVDQAAPLAAANSAPPNAELVQPASTRAAALVEETPAPPASILSGLAAAPAKPTIDTSSQSQSRAVRGIPVVPRRAGAAPQTRAAAIGSFDQANPYGK